MANGRVYKAALKDVDVEKGGVLVKVKRWLEVGDRQEGIFFIDYKDVSGRRVRKQVDSSTRQQADKVLRAALALNDKAEILGVDTVSAVTPKLFSDFVEGKEGFFENLTDCRPATVRSYRNSYDAIKDRFTGKTLRSITSLDIRNMMSARSAAGLEESTVNRDRSFLSAVFSMAQEGKFVMDNPVLAIDPLDGENEGRDFDEAEESRIFEHLKKPHWRDMTSSAMHTGMRRGEISKLEWSRVNLDEGFIYLGKRDTKGKYERVIPINATARGILERQLENLRESGIVSLWVFRNPKSKKGKPYNDSSLSHAFKRAVIKAGLPFEGPDKIVFHSTRHCFVSRMVKAGVPDRVIMKIVGHKSERLVARYSKLRDRDLMGATSVLVGNGVVTQARAQ